MPIRPAAYADGFAAEAMAFVLAGGRGSRLMELTERRAKPALPFGCGARVIDFALSNALNSGLGRIAIATGYQAQSLDRYLRRAWGFGLPLRGEYCGTADAIFQNIDVIRRADPTHMIVLAGDHVYKMNYEIMLRDHVLSGADVTVACAEVARSVASRFGVMRVDPGGKIVEFAEKPHNPPALPGKPGKALVSMGVYVFGISVLIDVLHRDATDPDSRHDFATDVIPSLIAGGRANAHRFCHSALPMPGRRRPYWQDIGTLDAYFRANIDVTGASPELDMDEPRWPVRASGRREVDCSVAGGGGPDAPDIRSSLIAAGATVSARRIRHSLVLAGAHAASDSVLDHCLILPAARVGRSARIKHAIVDSGVSIPAELVVGEDPELDARRFRRTDNGVCLITGAMIERLG